MGRPSGQHIRRGKPGNGNPTHIQRDQHKKAPKKRSTKNRIRDIKRLLSKEDLPANIRVTQERMLAALISSQHDQQHEKVAQKMNKKYHMVKFFERRKVMRRIAASEKALQKATDGDEKKRLSKVLKKHQKDMRYIKEFPDDKKYISLLKSVDEMTPQVVAKREKIYEQIMSENAKKPSQQLEDDVPVTSNNNLAADDFFAASTNLDGEDVDRTTATSTDTMANITKHKKRKKSSSKGKKS